MLLIVDYIGTGKLRQIKQKLTGLIHCTTVEPLYIGYIGTR